MLSSLHFGMFAVGNSMYADSYNAFGRRLHRQLLQLDARPFITLALADESKAECSFCAGKFSFQPKS